MTKQQDKDVSLVEKTQQRIIEYISNNKFDYNTVLPKEDEMAKILGVSRVVIREAYSGLRTLGFLVTKKKKGTIFVQPKVFSVLKMIIMSGILDQDTMRDLYEFRLMLEVGMADYVVANLTPKYLAQLEDIVNREDNTDNPEELVELDIEFHSVLYQISGNKNLLYLQTMLRELFRLYTRNFKNGKRYDILSHHALYDILIKRDAGMFRSAMRIHLENQYANQESNLSHIGSRGFDTNIPLNIN
jgi:DNA-binding FadR family transcriptional regulator